MEIIPLQKTDLLESETLSGKLLSLNNENAVELSWLDTAGLLWLVGGAIFARRIGQADAMMLAFDQDAKYDSPNFLWFKALYDRFIYVDRIVVSEKARGMGYGRLLYQELFDEAHRRGHSRIVCEVNSVPPNPASDAFHKSLGFLPIGSGLIDGGNKEVNYLEKKFLKPSHPFESDNT